MKLITGCSVLVIICATLAQDIGKTEDNEGRSLRDFNNQDWRALDFFSSTRDTEAEQVPRRRRIRKRKRRPPVASDDQIYEETVVRRKTRPQRLDQIREPWEDMSDEASPKSTSRRRLTPVFEENMKIRDPFTALQEAEEKQTTADLKAILKQSGGLSLSEVLQQKNLSLAELLKGNRQAISALVKNTESTTESMASTSKYRRLPPSVALKNKGNNRNEATEDPLTSHEVVEAQRKRLALLHGHSTMFPGVTKLDVVTEETTDKRIFVPSNPKFYTTMDSTTTPMSITTRKLVSPSKTRELPLTSAKLNKLFSKVTQNRIPVKAVTISINEIFGYNVLTETTETPDGPFKMSIDLDEITTENLETSPKPQTTTKSQEEVKTTTATLTTGEKLKRVTAKDEIMEIMKNPSDREQLSKILKSKNMTLEELVELRERGSSQLHLADIFHNKTREPEPKDEPFIGHINSADFNAFPFFNRKPKSRTMPMITTTPPPIKEIITSKPQYTITSFPTYKIETNKSLRPQSYVPVWKDLYPPPFFPSFYENNHYEERTEFIKPATTTERVKYDLESFEDIENTLAEATNSKLNVGLGQNVFNDNEFISLPSGVKSAILASLAIIGLSLLVFLTILVLFKWTQKQKRRLNYAGSFSGSKIKSPIIEPPQKRSFKTFVTETLGRKRMKNYYKTHLQSMSDNIWEHENEKKSYMI